jgi:hypothetical protein
MNGNDEITLGPSKKFIDAWIPSNVLPETALAVVQQIPVAILKV